MLPLTITPLQESDLDELLDLETLCFARGWSRLTFQAVLEDPQSYFIIARHQQKLVGYAGVHTVLDEANLDSLAVHPNYRQHGVAKQLLDNLLFYLKTKCIALFMLEVRQSNQPALALYHAFGFVVVGNRKQYYTHPTEDAVLMNLQL